MLAMLAALAILGCGSTANTSSRTLSTNGAAGSRETPEQQAEKQFRHLDVGPAFLTADSIQANSVTSDEFALAVFLRYYPLWLSNGHQLVDVDLSVPNQSGVPLSVMCRVVRDVLQQGVYVRCSAATGSVVAFSDRTLLAEPSPPTAAP